MTEPETRYQRIAREQRERQAAREARAKKAGRKHRKSVMLYTSDQRTADRIDGYDRDDLPPSPDY